MALDDTTALPKPPADAGGATAWVAEHLGERWTLASMPKEEPAVYDMLCRADSIGVFQVESRA